jgi:hypothetical protein
MNIKNYASFEASKRLVDAGIVLETEAYWIRVANSPMMLVDNRHGADEYYPATSMTDVWRELPQLIHKYQLTIKGEVSNALVGYSSREDWLYYVRDSNPTDALIDLLIWVRMEKP